MARRARPGLRGPGHDFAPDRLGATGPRLRRPAARGGVPVRGEVQGRPRLLDLRLQAGRLLAVCPDRQGPGTRQRRGAGAESQARERAPDRAGAGALVRALRRPALRSGSMVSAWPVPPTKSESFVRKSARTFVSCARTYVRFAA